MPLLYNAITTQPHIRPLLMTCLRLLLPLLNTYHYDGAIQIALFLSYFVCALG